MLRNITLQIKNIRWIFLLLFFIGYFLTKYQFSFVATEYFIYNLGALMGCALLLYQLKKVELIHVAVWMALIVIIMVYFVRFYWIAIDPSQISGMLPWNSYKGMLRQYDQLFHAFKLSVACFISFAISSAVMLHFLSYRNVSIPQSFNFDKDTHQNFVKLLLKIILPLMVLLTYFSYKYHIGEMGSAKAEPLPFRLKGIMFYTRTVFIPLLILQLIYSAERIGWGVISRLGIMLLMFHGVIDMFLRGSRSSLLLCMLLLVFLLLVGGIHLKRNEKVLIFITVALGFFMVPIITFYRNQRVEHGLLIFDALKNAIVAVRHNWNLLETLTVGIKFVLFRMPGVESVWAMLSQGAQPLGMKTIGILQSPNGVAGYLTYTVHPMKVENNTLLAPSYVGWFYIVAGLPAVALGGIVAAALTTFGWKSLCNNHLECRPIAQVFMLWMLFVVLTEGTLDTIRLMVFAGIICLVVIEFCLRIIKQRKF